ncbi:DUF445 domain-containing protein [Chitinophaga silvatica]|nr:hypothetical protein [Chitinophaga silvatica]
MIFILPLVSALIGWLINKLAVSFALKSLVKNQAAIASQLGEFAGKQISFDAIRSKLTSPENMQNLIPLVDKHLDSFLRERLPKAMPVLSMFIGDSIVSQIKSHLVSELDTLFPVLINQYLNNIEQDLNIQQIITSKINSIPPATLSASLQKSLAPQLKQFEMLGAVGGLIIGIINLVAYSLIHC